MAVAYFDCFAGAGGDMIVGALLDAGADESLLKQGLAGLGVAGLEVRVEKVQRRGVSGTKFSVVGAEEHHPHRRLEDILVILDCPALAPRAAHRAKLIFTRLAEAEAAVHNVAPQEVHFHEIGALDSIADIAGACIALELLDIDRILCSPIPLGSGIVECSHGTFPVPAPATSYLLKGAAVVAGELSGEITTPTAAAILTSLSESFGPIPCMKLSAVGYGAGTREGDALPNLLRVFVGEQADDGSADSVVELSANLDDCTGEIIAATLEALLSSGCLDAWATPIVMKKSRPAWTISALCDPADVAMAEQVIFGQTTTFGVRRHTCSRSKLLRNWQTVETRYGPIRVKVGRRGERIITASPEFSDCAAVAQAHHVSTKEVYQAAVAAYRQSANSRPQG